MVEFKGGQSPAAADLRSDAARSFSGKSIVITGGTQGVGLATARLLVARGAEAVTICGRNEANGEKAAAELEAAGARALFVAADLSRPDDCFAVIDRAADTFGKIDSLINCCGSTKRGTLENTTPELWDYLFAVNVRAPFLLTQRAVPVMRAGKRGGTIANIGSIAAHGGQPYITAYCAAKGALLVLTKTSPIRCAGIASGSMRSISVGRRHRPSTICRRTIISSATTG